MQPSQFKQEFSELLATSKSSDAEFRALNSDALHQMHQSYGVAPHKWNQIENSPKLDYLFRADLETRIFFRFQYSNAEALEREKKKDKAKMEIEQIEKDIRQMRIREIRNDFKKTAKRREKKTTQLNSLTSTNTSQDFGSTTLDKQRSLLQRQTENVGQGRGMQDRSGNDRIETEEWAGLTNHGPMQKQARPTTSIHHARKTQSNPSPTINYLPPHQSFDDVEEAVEIEDDEDLEEHEAALQQSPTEPAVSTEVHSGQPDGLQTQEQPRPLRHRPSDGRRQLSPTSSDAVIPAESTEQTPFNPNKEAHATSTERVLSARPPKMEVRTYPLLFVPVSEDESDTQPPKRQTQTRKPRPVSAQVSQPPLSHNQSLQAEIGRLSSLQTRTIILSRFIRCEPVTMIRHTIQDHTTLSRRQFIVLVISDGR
ncbi:hypothetical protein BLNAU_24853 [Blattamonas nauphoetae]|uniref:Uncharacterized protein n=1 Tax=Blattamonas nauphoetae TaxID=2049346 RepID=A0ABQ9WL95_9EUKA|nr:hypothetical protein BLNAU_24853 [Blattamonas nauphoetae]